METLATRSHTISSTAKAAEAKIAIDILNKTDAGNSVRGGRQGNELQVAFIWSRWNMFDKKNQTNTKVAGSVFLPRNRD